MSVLLPPQPQETPLPQSPVSRPSWEGGGRGGGVSGTEQVYGSAGSPFTVSKGVIHRTDQTFKMDNRPDNRWEGTTNFGKWESPLSLVPRSSVNREVVYLDGSTGSGKGVGPVRRRRKGSRSFRSSRCLRSSRTALSVRPCIHGPWEGVVLGVVPQTLTTLNWKPLGRGRGTSLSHPSPTRCPPCRSSPVFSWTRVRGSEGRSLGAWRLWYSNCTRLEPRGPTRDQTPSPSLPPCPPVSGEGHPATVRSPDKHVGGGIGGCPGRSSLDTVTRVSRLPLNTYKHPTSTPPSRPHRRETTGGIQTRSLWDRNNPDSPTVLSDPGGRRDLGDPILTDPGATHGGTKRTTRKESLARGWDRSLTCPPSIPRQGP